MCKIQYKIYSTIFRTLTKSKNTNIPHSIPTIAPTQHQKTLCKQPWSTHHCVHYTRSWLYLLLPIHSSWKTPLYLWILSPISTDSKMILFTFSIWSNQMTVTKIRGNYIPYLMFKLLHCFLAFYPCPLKNKYLNTHSAYVPEICWWNSKMKETVKSVCCMFVSWWWFNPTLLKRPPTRNRTKWTISLPPFTSPTACQGPAWTWKK